MQSRRLAILEILRPRVVKIWLVVVGVVPLYDVGCNQFGWPKIPTVWGMSGSLIPWWGWLLLAQAGLTYGLFEYVRRLSRGNTDGSTNNEEILQACAILQERVERFEVCLQTAEARLESIAEDRIKNLQREIDSIGGSLLPLQLGVQHSSRELDNVKSQAERALVQSDTVHQQLGPIELRLTKFERYYTLSSIESVFEERFKNLEDQLKHIQTVGESVSMPIDRFNSQKHLRALMESFSNEIALLAGRKIDVTLSPNFDKNQLRSVEGEQNFSDAGLKGDYRRLKDQYDTAVGSFRIELDKLARERNELASELMMQGFVKH